MPNRFVQCLAVGVFLLLSVSASFAATISITPATGNTFTVMGSNMDGVSAIDLTLSYDGSLSTPSASQGNLVSGSLFAANTNFGPNSIKIGIIRSNAFSGSGPIATISFARGSGSLKINSMNLVNASGSSMPGSTAGGGDGSTSGTTSGTSGSTTTTTTTGTGGGSLSTGLGTVTMPTDSQPPKETKPAEPPAAAVPPQPAPAAPAEATPPPSEQAMAAPLPEEQKKPESTKVTTYSSVAERFRAYQGEKSPAILAALFKKEVAPTIRQEPPVALSDGITSLKIIASLASKDSRSPNFALNGAKLVSLKKDEESDKWIIEAMPQTNTLNAWLTILNGSDIFEYPLTVAPPLKSRIVNEADFAAFLKNHGKGSDLNGDGKYDYLDDYIYTANYIVWLEKSKADKKPQQPAK